MAPTEDRVAKPERRWDCHSGTPVLLGGILLTECCHTDDLLLDLPAPCLPPRRVDLAECHRRSFSARWFLDVHTRIISGGDIFSSVLKMIDIIASKGDMSAPGAGN